LTDATDLTIAAAGSIAVIAAFRTRLAAAWERAPKLSAADYSRSDL